MRQPLQLTFDPDCDCEDGLVVLQRTMGDGDVIISNNPTLCSCVKADATQPRLPCPNCGGLAVRDGRCIGCDLARLDA